MLSAIEGLLQDVRYGVRGLRRRPGFALAAILAAALGIGASTAVFSAVDRILFRPLPYRDEARLVSVGIMAPLDSNEFLLAEGYFDLRRNPGPLAEVTSFQAGNFACDLTENHPLRLHCLRAEANFLPLLGIAPAAGRTFTAGEGRPHGPAVAMISYGLWSSRFARDPGVVGRTLTGLDVLLPEALDESRERSGRQASAAIFGAVLAVL
jgi:hypothetical protein